LLETGYFRLQSAAAERGEAIGLASPGGVVFLEALDPAIVEQAAERAVERAGAEHDAAGAYFLDIFEDGISVARVFGQAEQDEQDRFSEGRKAHI
jgi:hypothetical protein